MTSTARPTTSTNVATVHEIYVAFGGGARAGGPAHFTPKSDKADVAQFFDVISGYTLLLAAPRGADTTLS
jgi:hypothetical protein